MNTTAAHTPYDVDVLVVGAGPAGLTLANLLAREGVDALTITKYPSTAHSPRAHITNQRAMEVYRDLGLEAAVRAVATDNSYLRNNVWATSFAGREIACLETWGAGVERSSDYEAASPTAMCNVPQHRLEPVLLDGALAAGAQVRFDTELIAVAQDEAGVTARVRDRRTGAESALRARYAVGADGARSRVAEQLGFSFTGETDLGAALNIWLEADLTQYCEHRRGTLYWMAQPGNDYWVGSGTWINVTPFTEWVLLVMYDPAEEPDMSEEALIERARLTIGDPDVEITIKSASKWSINHLVADDYRRGRAFLAGDAAHRHPPANGLGTNTSAQDAFNLAWKLAAVLRGQAGDALLDTYSAERQPVGRHVVDRALKSVEDMAGISRALGFEPGQSAEEGWAALDALFGPGEAARARRDEFNTAIELQNHQFNALGTEMDVRYASTAVLADPADEAPERPADRDPNLHFEPSARPGAMLPHARIERERRAQSSIDVVGHGRFALVTGIDDAAWRQAVDEFNAQAAAAGRPGLELVQIAQGGQWHDVFAEWDRLRSVGDAGALLVRPDRVIAARFPAAADAAEARARLGAALDAILGTARLAPA